MDRYYEESAISQKKDKDERVFNALHVLCLIFAGISIILIGFSIFTVRHIFEDYTGTARAWQLFQLFAPLVGTLGISAFFYFFKFRFNVSYDYILVDDEVRVARVCNGRRRKLMYRFKKDFILQIGFCERESFQSMLSENVKAIYLTANEQPTEGKIFIYMLHSDSNGKFVFVFECREMFMEYLARMVGRNKLELK